VCAGRGEIERGAGRRRSGERGSGAVDHAIFTATVTPSRNGTSVVTKSVAA
jgi:hypothetical protein